MLELLCEKVPGLCTKSVGPQAGQIGYAPVLLSTSLPGPHWELGTKMPVEAAMKFVHSFAQREKYAFTSSSGLN